MLKVVAAISVISVMSALLVACGGGQAEPQTPASNPGAAAVSSSPAPATSAGAAAAVAWSDSLPQAQKVAIMKTSVAPRMSKVFQLSNAARYANFGCPTCHGPNRQAPKDYLPKLSMKDGKPSAFAEKPEIAQFMAEKVAPQMASALGVPAYDPASGKGFGCMGCHATR